MYKTKIVILLTFQTYWRYYLYLPVPSKVNPIELLSSQVLWSFLTLSSPPHRQSLFNIVVFSAYNVLPFFTTSKIPLILKGSDHMSSQFCSHDHLHFFFSLLSLCALTYLPLSIDYIIKGPRQLFICQNRNCCCFILKHPVFKTSESIFQ